MTIGELLSELNGFNHSDEVLISVRGLFFNIVKVDANIIGEVPVGRDSYREEFGVILVGK